MNSLVLYTTEDGEIQLVLAEGLYFNIYLKEKTATVVRSEQSVVGWAEGDGDEIFGGYYGGDIVIPESITADGVEYVVTVIGPGAFENCWFLTSITIPDTIRIIGNHSFRGCKMLASVDIPSSVSFIGNDAFLGCTGFTSIVIPDSVKEILPGAFAYCDSLKSVEIPKTDIMICPQSETFCKLIGRDYKHECDLYYRPHSEKPRYAPKSRTISIDDVNIDETSMFRSCPKDYVGGFVIPDGVKIIGKNAFEKCEGLEYVIMPDSVMLIESSAFRGCSNLEYVRFSRSLAKIGDEAFRECRRLSGGTLPDTVDYIGKSAFEACHFSSVRIPNKIKIIEYDTYAWNGWLLRVEIPNTVRVIKGYAFSDCALEKVDIPDSVFFIDDGAFSESSLKEINLPSSLLHIGDGAFEDCNELKEFHSRIEDMCVFEGECILDGVDKETCIIYVPKGCEDAYRHHPAFKDFKNILEEP